MNDITAPSVTDGETPDAPEPAATSQDASAATAGAPAPEAAAADASEAVVPEADASPSDADGPAAEAADSSASAARAADTEGDEEEARPTETAEERLKRLEEEGDIAADYLEELLDIADMDGDIDIDVDGDRASVEIRGADQLARLNKPSGELMDALQELARLAVQTRTGERSRLMLDIGGFRAEHRTSLEELADGAIAKVKEGGEAVPLRPMNPFERKVVHDVVKREGLRSESEGDGKGRHVVIYPS